MKRILEDIQQERFSQIYLLYGEENYLRNQYRDKLLTALVSPGDEMNFARFAGRGIDEQEIIDLAETLPFLAERRVILVEDSGFFKNKTERLADYMATLPEHLVLLFSEEEVDKRSRLYKAVQNTGLVVVFAEQSGETLTKWVLQTITREGKKITRPDMERFLSITGSDMNNIRQELEKLLSYCGDRDVIATADIDAVCSPRLENRIFDMVRAAAARKKKEAFELYRDLLALKEPPMRILSLLGREFNNLRRIAELRNEGVPDDRIAKAIGIPAFAVRRAAQAARNYAPESLRELTEKFVQAEEDVKTGRLEDRLAVELMLVETTA